MTGIPFVSICGQNKSEWPFTVLTEYLLRQKRVNGLWMQFVAAPPLKSEWEAMNEAFGGKQAAKGDGKTFLWADWLVESLFPTTLYKQNGSDLLKMVRDSRVWEIAGFSGNWNNSFGRMARPRDELQEGFVQFLVERLRSKYRGMPHFFFDVEHPEWVCAPLYKRPDIPKTGRTSVSCVMLYGFQYLNEKLHITIMLRHLNWSHGWGDIFGGHAALQAVCKATDLTMGNVTIFANSASMDEPKIARSYLKEIQK